MTELLKQGQYAPLQMEEEVAVLFAGVKGYLDNIAVDQVSAFEQSLLITLRGDQSGILESIKTEQKISDKNEERLKKVLSQLVDEYLSKAKA